MEVRDQRRVVTLAQKLGDVTHVSPLLRRVKELSGCSEERVGEWLLKCAVERGATHYRRSFPPDLAPDDLRLSNEELGVALCLEHLPFEPMFIRAAAQLLSGEGIDAEKVRHLALMERCEPVLLHIAEAAFRVAKTQEPWAYLRANLQTRHRTRTDALPHWSRFVLQTGYTEKGRGQHIEWLVPDE
jgi:hypothetical protein